MSDHGAGMIGGEPAEHAPSPRVEAWRCPVKHKPAKGHTHKHSGSGKHGGTGKHHPVHHKPAPRSGTGGGAGGGPHGGTPPIVGKHPHHPKARGLALGEAWPCCAAEAVAASLRLAGGAVSDADVLALHGYAGGTADAGVPLLVALEAAAEVGLAGVWPVGFDLIPPEVAVSGAVDQADDRRVGQGTPGTGGQLKPLRVGADGREQERQRAFKRERHPQEFVSGDPALAALNLAHGRPVPGVITQYPHARNDGPLLEVGAGAGGANVAGEHFIVGRHELQSSIAQRPAHLILGVELPGAHAVAADAGAWWSWGQPYCPCEFPGTIVEEAWAVAWPVAGRAA